ncbi:hypothetical protein BDV19DRAFT_384106 [Aspergillus venezuelensis]
MADFAGPSINERFRRLLRRAMPIKWGLFHHRHTATYYRDRVVLLGDSAHASLPFQAAGAGQGLEDALVLSNILYHQHLETGSDMYKALGKLQHGWIEWIWFHDLKGDIKEASKGIYEIANKQMGKL